MSLVSKLTSDGVRLGMLKLTINILEEIKNGQKEDLELVDKVVLLNQGKGGDFRLDENGVLMVLSNHLYINAMQFTFSLSVCILNF